MSNKSKKMSIFGIIVGIVIIIIGFCVQDISVDTSEANVGSSYLKFGADFYTEIYDVTRDVGLAINNAQENICNAVEHICDAIGWLIVSLGAIVICFFAYKVVTFSDLSESVDTDKNANRMAEEKAKCDAEEKAIKRQAAEELLSISDIEGASSAFLNRRVSISDITCTLIYVIPKSTGKPKEMHLDMSVGAAEFTSLDLFFDQKRKAYFFKGRQLALDDAWRSEEEIFGFNVTMFKEFSTEVDEDE